MKKTYYYIATTVLFLFMFNLIRIKNIIPFTSDNINFDKNVLISDKYFFLENWKDSISLSQIVKKHPCLILRIPTSACQHCKHDELNRLKTTFSKNELKKCVALISVFTARDLKKITLNYNFDYLKIGSKRRKVLNVKQENYGKVYYFVLHQNMEGSDFFFPQQTKPELTKDYLLMIKKKYLSK